MSQNQSQTIMGIMNQIDGVNLHGIEDNIFYPVSSMGACYQGK